MRLLHTQNEYRDVVARPALAELEISIRRSLSLEEAYNMVPGH